MSSVAGIVAGRKHNPRPLGASLLDQEAPTVPQNLVATAVSSSRIDLTWDASQDNVGVDHYNVYRDGAGTPIAQPTTNSYSDTGLTADTAYSYTVSAEDAAGNESAESTPDNATTDAAALPAVESTTVDNSGGMFDPSLTTSHNHPSGADRMLVFVGVAKASTGAFTSVSATYGGQAMTLVDSIGADNTIDTNTRTAEYLFDLTAPSSGTNNVVVSTNPDSRTTVRIYSISNGNSLGTPETRVVSGDVASTDLSVQSATDDLVLRGTHWRNSSADITFPAGQTGVDDDGVNAQGSRAGASWKRATGGPTSMPADFTSSDSNQRHALVGVAVQAVAGVPVANDDSANAEPGGSSIEINVGGNDTYAGTWGDLTVEFDTTGTAGTGISKSATTNMVNYTPPATAQTDTFDYRITDANGTSAFATVTVTVAEAGEVTLLGSWPLSETS